MGYCTNDSLPRFSCFFCWCTLKIGQGHPALSLSETLMRCICVANMVTLALLFQELQPTAVKLQQTLPNPSMAHVWDKRVLFLCSLGTVPEQVQSRCHYLSCELSMALLEFFNACSGVKGHLTYHCWWFTCWTRGYVVEIPQIFTICAITIYRMLAVAKNSANCGQKHVEMC